MQSILTGLGVLAVAGTTWLVADNAISSAPPPSVFQSAEAPALPEAFSTRNVTVDSPTTLVTVFNAMREASDDRLVVRWGALGEAGFERETEIETIVGDLPFDGMLRELRTVLGGHQGERLDWRYTDGRIEVATRYYFDQRERTLVRYDISEIRNYGVASDEDVQSLLTTFTSPEDWESNGGDLARMQLVSDHLFIEAPPRIHQKVEWLLNELRAKKAAAAPGAERAGETTSAALQSGDAVAIEVWDVYVPGEMTRIERIVERDGVLRFPAPFGLVKAQGRSFDEIEEELTLRMSEFVNEPRLSLFTPVGPKDVATAGRHN